MAQRSSKKKLRRSVRRSRKRSARRSRKRSVRRSRKRSVRRSRKRSVRRSRKRSERRSRKRSERRSRKRSVRFSLRRSRKTSRLSVKESVKPEWTIYTMEGCPWCKKAGEILEMKGQRYRKIDGVGNPEVEEKMRKAGRLDYKYWPKIFYKDEFIGGYTDLEKRLS